jgi:hypothetical protein
VVALEPPGAGAAVAASSPHPPMTRPIPVRAPSGAVFAVFLIPPVAYHDATAQVFHPPRRARRSNPAITP